jgi:hypothetical protein
VYGAFWAVLTHTILLRNLSLSALQSGIGSSPKGSVAYPKQKFRIWIRPKVSFGSEFESEFESVPIQIRIRIRIPIRIPDLDPDPNPGLGSRSETSQNFFLY